MRRAYDASTPSKNPPPWWICAFYIGGDTLHVWTDQQIMDDKARFGLPIWVNNLTDSAEQGRTDGLKIVSWLTAHKIPRGCNVVIDTETAVLPDYIRALDAVVTGAGYLLMNYGSLDYVIHNPLTSGGRWTADWTGIQHIDQVPGERACQFASASQLGTDYDASVVEDHVVLWEKHPPKFPPPIPWEDVALQQVDSALDHLSAAQRMIRSHIPK